MLDPLFTSPERTRNPVAGAPGWFWAIEPFHQKMHRIGKHYQKKRMIGNLRMPGKVVKVHSFA
jgi:hypothetical protein